MIPKVIHYCWFGGNPMPELALKCINSWKEFCPGYEIVRWDEHNFNVLDCPYSAEAYEKGKWAFVSDYARLKIIYEYGGIYMDTDVEVCKPLDLFLNNQAFSGFENDHQIPTGIMAAEKGHLFFKRLLEYYDKRHFVLEDGSLDVQTNVEWITKIALENGLIPNDSKQVVCGLTLYPHDIFCPKSHLTGLLNITDNTACIHHFDGSWRTDTEKQLTEVSQQFNRHFGKAGPYLYKAYKYVMHPKWLAEKAILFIRKGRSKTR